MLPFYVYTTATASKYSAHISLRSHSGMTTTRVTFFADGTPSGSQFWEPIEVNQGGVKVIIQFIHVPKVDILYQDLYGLVDRSEQQLSYNTECRSVRKQSRIFGCLSEMHALVNGYTMWCESPNLMANHSRDCISRSEFQFSPVRVWYAKFKKPTEDWMYSNQPLSHRCTISFLQA